MCLGLSTSRSRPGSITSPEFSPHLAPIPTTCTSQMSSNSKATLLSKSNITRSFTAISMTRAVNCRTSSIRSSSRMSICCKRARDELRRIKRCRSLLSEKTSMTVSSASKRVSFMTRLEVKHLMEQEVLLLNLHPKLPPNLT